METATIEKTPTTASRPQTSATTMLAAADGNIVPIQNAFFQELNKQAQSTVVKNLDIQNMVPVDEATLGDFPWFWNNLGVFNLATYQWLNNVFSYNPAGYVQAGGTELTTAYFNAVAGISYQLSAAETATVNNAVNANAAVANTLYNDWISFAGPIPAANGATMASKLAYITAQIMSWGASDLTLGTLRVSLNPISLLPNMPLGADTVVNDFMTYMAATSAIAGIQSSVWSRNIQLAALLKNLQPAPATASQGWMQTVDANGKNTIVPELDIKEPIAAIKNSLYPTGGTGNSFSVGMTVTKLDQSTVKVTADGGFGGSGFIGWLGLSGNASASYNMFSFSQQTQSCTVNITFNGVTKITPTPFPFDISSNTGWWMPSVIKDAVNFDPNVGGYQFSIPSSYDFGNNGTFGVVSSLIISQLPTFEMVYTSTDYSSFQQSIQEQSSWGVSFLGIPLAGGSQSYYKASLSQDSKAGTITVTMSPPANSTPVPTLGQVAFVVGAEILWPAA